ncbi:transposable element Tcb2 transposase [Trichonephila clavipes]|nr:transposable element Tcb2 transposase [Trichonephila clavipes]
MSSGIEISQQTVCKRLSEQNVISNESVRKAHAQLKATATGRTEAQLKTFAASASLLSYGSSGVVVCGGILLIGRTRLHVFDRGSVTGDHYCKDVISPHVRLFRGAIGPDFVFMDGNVRPNRTADVQQLLESEDISRMDLPVFSPDLNLI